MCVPFLPLFLYDLGIHQEDIHLWAGIVLSSSFFVGIFMGPIWGVLADRYGKRKMMIRAGVGLVVVYALLAIVHNPWELIAVRLLHGFVMGFIPAAMAYVASMTAKERLSSQLGLMQSAMISGGIMGPLLGGVLASTFGLRESFFVGAVIVGIATFAVILFVKEAPRVYRGKKDLVTDRETPRNFRDFFRSPVLLSMLSLLLVYQIAISTLQPILPLHLADLQGHVKEAALSSGFVLSLVGISGMIASPIWGKLERVWGPQGILKFCLLVSACLITAELFVRSVWLFSVVQFLYGLFIAGIIPIVNTLIQRNSSEQSRGRSFGLISSVNQLGGMVGPIIGSMIGIGFGNQWVFLAIGLLLILAMMRINYIFSLLYRQKILVSFYPLPQKGDEQKKPPKSLQY